MRGSTPCELFVWRLAMLARLVRRGDTSEQPILPSGSTWQELVYVTARATGPYLDVQGPGRGALFGRYGSSGMGAEIDTAVDYGAGLIVIAEAKAVSDFTLRRDEAFILSGKIRDHESSQEFRWPQVQALIASAGRVDAVFSRWCFHEGIDVVDPDRLPLTVLARLPYFLTRGELSVLRDYAPFHWLRDLLRMTREEMAHGPVLLRDRCRHVKFGGDVLRDLNDIQGTLSDAVWAALRDSVSAGSDNERESAMLDALQLSFYELGIPVAAPSWGAAVRPVQWGEKDQYVGRGDRDSAEAARTTPGETAAITISQT